MVHMSASGVLPRAAGLPFTRAELDALPDDGRRHELIDGVLIVTPSPVWQHQRVVIRLVVRLSGACPDDCELLSAPFDVALAEDTIVQPDLLVARRSDLTEKDLPAAPLLAIEVLSPSTRHLDLGFKRARYEEAGVRSYWVVDPKEPSIIVLTLRDGVYVEAGRAVGDESITVDQPFPVTLSPAALING